MNRYSHKDKVNEVIKNREVNLSDNVEKDELPNLKINERKLKVKGINNYLNGHMLI